MTNKNITDLTAAGAGALSDLFITRQGADTEDKKMTGTQLKALLTTTANQLSVFAEGTAYSLTNTSAALDFGTTDPSLTLTAAGTYMIFGRVLLNYNGATFAANRDVNLKLRRTNNTAADLPGGGSGVIKTGIVTTWTESLGLFTLFAAPYVTVATDDVIKIFGDVSTVPSAGSLDAVAASIVAYGLQT